VKQLKPGFQWEPCRTCSGSGQHQYKIRKHELPRDVLAKRKFPTLARVKALRPIIAEIEARKIKVRQIQDIFVGISTKRAQYMRFISMRDREDGSNDDSLSPYWQTLVRDPDEVIKILYNWASFKCLEQHGMAALEGKCKT